MEALESNKHSESSKVEPYLESNKTNSVENDDYENDNGLNNVSKLKNNNTLGD